MGLHARARKSLALVALPGGVSRAALRQSRLALRPL
jgi:hypothetical protein